MATALLLIAFAGLPLAFWLGSRRQARHAAEPEVTRMLEIIDGVPGIVFEYDLYDDGRRRANFVSGGMENLIGVPAPLVREDVDRYFATALPEDLPAYLAEIERSGRTLTEIRWSFRIRHARSGEVRWLEVHAPAPRRIDGGMRWHGYINDITGQKQLELELAAARARIVDITNSAPGFLIELRKSGSGYAVTYASAGVEAAIGLPAEQVMADIQAAFALVHPEDLDGVVAAIEKSAATLSGIRHEYRLRHAVTGELRWLQLNASPPVLQDGTWTWRIYELDVTERVQLEHDLSRARDAAQAAERAKGEFLANMSHEIRTPMNAIIGMSHLALQTELSPRQLNHLNKIEAAARNLRGIIDDILDYSKIEAGKLSLESVVFSPQGLFDDLVAMVGLRAEQKGLRLRFELDPALPGALLGDPLRLGQVLTNFCSNAIKFTERGEVVVSAQMLQRAGATARLRFTVRDTGIGLDQAQQGRLFQAFQQADTSTTRKYGGTGLGLTICRRLVDLMDGTLGVDSAPGQGSTFWFCVVLGVPVDAIAPAAGPAARGAAALEAARQLRGVRVLLAEDHEVNQEIAREILGAAGVAVTLAGNGQQALELLRAGSFDLVLMDVQMPVLDGLAAAAAIRREARWDSLPVIAMTASALPADVEKCRAAGMQDHIAKPIDVRELYATLARWAPRGESAPGPGA